MIRTRSNHTGVRRAVAVIVAVAVLAGSTAASAQAAGEAPEDFSLLHIPEALPLESAMADNPEASGWYAESEDEPQEDLSMTRAILYSLLLPGLGDWYAGKKDRAKMFFIVDAALWTTFIVFQVQGHQREESFKEFAQTFAGVASTDHSDDFYSEIGQYNTSNDYEAQFKKDSRIELWPNVGYDTMEDYYVENRVADFEEWAWQTWERRVDYRELRSASKVSYRRSGYVIAFAALNRVVASVFAYQAVKASRGELDDGGGAGTQSGSYRLDISSPPIGARGDFTAAVSLVRSF